MFQPSGTAQTCIIGSRTVAIDVQYVGVGWFVGCYEKGTGVWTSLWQTPLFETREALEAAVTKAGGVAPFISAIVAEVNRILLKLFGNAATPADRDIIPGDPNEISVKLRTELENYIFVVSPSGVPQLVRQ